MQENIVIDDNVYNYVYNQEIEGTGKLESVKPFRFGVLCCFPTCFFSPILYLISKLQSLECLFACLFCKINQATHYYIKDSDETYSIIKRCQQDQAKDRLFEDQIAHFTYRDLKYIERNDHTITVACLDYQNHLSRIQYQRENYKGLTENQVKKMRYYFGQGLLTPKKPSLIRIWISQLFRPFYLFIIFSCVIWITQEYYPYAIIILFFSVIILSTTLFNVNEMTKTLYKDINYQIMMDVKRDGVVKKMMGGELVTGDLIFLSSIQRLSFDCLILFGNALVNESQLTGNPELVVKKANPTNNYKMIQKQFSKDSPIVYDGTRSKYIFKEKGAQINWDTRQISQFSQNNPNISQTKYGIPAVVIRTNFSTKRGQILRSIMNARQSRNIFQHQYQWILFILFLFAICCFGGIVIWKLSPVLSKMDIFRKVLDIITITVPPGLALSLSISIQLTLRRLNRQSILCASPDTINAAGMVQTIFFDKTGTLTENYIHFQKLIPYQMENQTKIKEVDKNYKQEWRQQQLKQLQTWNILYNCIINILMNRQFILDENKQYYLNDRCAKNCYSPNCYYDSFLFDLIGFDCEIRNKNNPIKPTLKRKTKNQRQRKKYKEIYGRNSILEDYKYSDLITKYQFHPDLRRSSIIVRLRDHKDVNSVQENQSQYKIYTKGCPQTMKTLMKSIPPDYDQTIKIQAAKGRIVLAIASKSLVYNRDQNQNYIRINIPKLTRQQVQRNLDFNGFVILQNKLKEQSIRVIKQISQAHINCIMITGDNPETSIYTANKCQITDKRFLQLKEKDSLERVEQVRGQVGQIGGQVGQIALQIGGQIGGQVGQIGRQVRGQVRGQIGGQVREQIGGQIGGQVGQIGRQVRGQVKGQIGGQIGGQVGQISQHRRIYIHNNSLQRFKIEQEVQQKGQQKIEYSGQQKVEYWMKGITFKLIVQKWRNDNRNEEMKKQIYKKMKNLLKKIKIFCLCNPQQKVQIIKFYQQMGQFVAMVGDGINDAGALKQANAGLSLDKSQTSISSPFISNIKNSRQTIKTIKPVQILLRQSRAGLITSISIFNIMVVYSLIQCTTTIIAEFFNTLPNLKQYLYWDLACNFFFFLVVSFSKTSKKLNCYTPKELFSKQNIFNILSIALIQFLGQLSVTFIRMQHYQISKQQNKDSLKQGQENPLNQKTPLASSLFLFASFMYTFSVLSLARYRPWKGEFWTNKPFIIVLFLSFVANTIITFIPINSIQGFQLIGIEGNFQGVIFGLALAFGLIMLVIAYISYKCSNLEKYQPER